MKDHKPNRRQRRAMNRIGNRIVKKIYKENLITKVSKDENTEQHDTNT